MGRYDKIKVYNGVAFVQPSKIMVYKGDNLWEDLGTNTSGNTNNLHVYDGTEIKRVTLLRRTRTYSSGGTLTTNNSGIKYTGPTIGYCTKYTDDSSYNEEFRFTATVKRSSFTSDKRIFYTGTSSNHVEILWLANGKFQVSIQSQFYSGAETVITTPNAYDHEDEEYEIDLRGAKGSWTAKLYIDGDLVRSVTCYNTFCISNTGTTKLGSSGIYFTGSIYMKGRYISSGSPKTKTIDKDVEEINDSSAFTGTKNYEEDTYTTYEWY